MLADTVDAKAAVFGEQVDEGSYSQSSSSPHIGDVADGEGGCDGRQVQAA